MAYTIDEAKVKTIAGLPDSADVTTFIEVATVILDESLVGKGLSDNRLSLIGNYLAAHYAYLSLSDSAGLRARKMGEASETFWSPGDTAFSGTPYGLQAIALDTTGTLAVMVSGKGLRAEFRVV